MKSQRHSSPANPMRRLVLLGLGSLSATPLLSACGGGGGSAQTGPSNAASTGTSSSAATRTSASATASGTAVATPSASAPASGFVLGVFSGGYNSTQAETYDTWLGVDTSYNVDFLTSTSTSWDIGQWAPLKKAQPAHNMLFSVPLNDMPGIIMGSYDSMFKSMAEDIAAVYPSAIIRIGWEMNGSWYPWAAANVVSSYIEAYNHAAAIFRSASATFLLDWCPNNGVSSNMDCALAYPGDEYVDCVGMDTYMDYRYGSGTSTSRWHWLVGNSRGLQWQVDFAGEHGKRLSIPEWGVNKDDPLFITNMYDWLMTNKYHHASYWDSNSDFQSQLSGNQYPNAAAQFKALFGA